LPKSIGGSGGAVPRALERRSGRQPIRHPHPSRRADGPFTSQPKTWCSIADDAPTVRYHCTLSRMTLEHPETNFALQLKGWRENMENFCGSKPPEGGCGSRQAQGFYPLWQPTASVFHGNRRFADCDPIAQFDRFDPRTTIGLPLEVRAVSRALDFLIPVSEALPQRGTRDSNPQPRVPTRSQNRKRPNAQSHRANGVKFSGFHDGHHHTMCLQFLGKKESEKTEMKIEIQ
ncbi:Lipoprotein signal peptidase, partial [Frankliniella fusca]